MNVMLQLGEINSYVLLHIDNFCVHVVAVNYWRWEGPSLSLMIFFIIILFLFGVFVWGLFWFFLHRVSLCSSCWPRPHCVAQSGLHLMATLLLNFPRVGISGLIYYDTNINFYVPLFFIPANWIDKAILQETPEEKTHSKVDKAIEIAVNLG